MSGTRGKPRLVATAGATVGQIDATRLGEKRGKGVPMQLTALGTPGGEVAGRPCGLLWVERCELVGVPPELDVNPPASPTFSEGSSPPSPQNASSPPPSPQPQRRRRGE